MDSENNMKIIAKFIQTSTEGCGIVMQEISPLQCADVKAVKNMNLTCWSFLTSQQLRELFR